MAQDSSEIVVAASGDVSIAPVGTTLPTTLVALDENWANLGYTTEDGVTFSDSVEIEEIRAWQSANPVRKIVTARDKTVAFSLEQWNPDNFILAYGGGEWSEPTPGIYRFDPPAVADAIAEYSMVIDWADGDKQHRVVIERGNVQEGVETQLIRSGAAVLPITFGTLNPDDPDASAWYHLTDDPAFSVAS